MEIFCICKGNCLSSRGRSVCVCRKNKKKCGAKCCCNRGRIVGCMNSRIGKVFLDPDVDEPTTKMKKMENATSDRKKVKAVSLRNSAKTKRAIQNSTLEQFNGSLSGLSNFNLSAKESVPHQVPCTPSRKRKSTSTMKDITDVVSETLQELDAIMETSPYKDDSANCLSEPVEEFDLVIKSSLFEDLVNDDSETRDELTVTTTFNLNNTNVISGTTLDVTGDATNVCEFDAIQVMQSADLRSILRYILEKNHTISLSTCMTELKMRATTEKDPTTITSADECIDPPEPNPGLDGDSVPFCKCLNCVPMPTPAERLCCSRRQNTGCITEGARFRDLVLDRDVLRIQMGLRFDLGGIVYDVSNKHYRHAAYRQYVAWQYGYLGKNNRRVLPTCAVAVIRRMYPSPNGRYRGYVPPPPRRIVQNNTNIV